MATLTQLASRYRWELMLLVGIPFINLMSRWLLIKILANFNLSLPDWFCGPYFSCGPDFASSIFDLLLPLLLGFLYYFHVRHIRRTTLSLLWAYAIVFTAYGEAMSLLYQGIDPEWRSRAPWTWWNEGQTFIQLIILMWFARQASKISFSHALVLIGLVNVLFDFGRVMPLLVFPLLDDRVGAFDIAALAILVTIFAVWVLSRVDVSRDKHGRDIERWISSWDIAFYSDVKRFAVRVLPRFDPAGGISKELLVALFGLNLLLYAYPSVRSWVAYEYELATIIWNMVVVFVYSPLWTVLVILLAYGVRVRQPTEDPATIEPKARPTKPFLCPSYGSREEPPTS